MKNRIKECRLAAGMTRKELADAIEIPTEAIKGIEESKENDNTLAWFEKVAAVLNVTPAYLVGWSDNSGQSTFTDDQLNTVEKAADWKQSAEEKLRKLYAGGVVFHLKDGAKLYDHTDISDVEWNTDIERSLVMYDKNYIVPTDNVAYVESIPDKEE